MMEMSSRKLKCVIVEDEQPAQWVLSSYISQVDQLELVGCAFDATEAFQLLEQHQVDVLFLDINLPGLSGFDMLNTLKYQPMVVFTTAFSQYALNSFEYNVVDYLVKPITRQQFNRAVERVIERANLLNLKTQMTEPEDFEDVEIKMGMSSEWVNPTQIVYLQSYGNYVKVILEGHSLMATSSTRKMMETLPASIFLQIHKSFIVNKKYISSYTNNDVLVLEKRLPIGISYKQAVMSSIDSSLSDDNRKK
jgi:DNA-binding LytR/AlgR family response regulator